jgi:hypothetical protein
MLNLFRTEIFSRKKKQTNNFFELHFFHELSQNTLTEHVNKPLHKIEIALCIRSLQALHVV